MYEGDEKQFLANLDACMIDDRIPFLESRLELPDEKISYCINLPEFRLKTIYENNSIDASGGTYYVVLGVNGNPQLKAMEDASGYEFYESENEILQEVCQAINNVSEFLN